MTGFDTPANRYASLALGSFELTARACKVTVVADPCRCGKTNGPQMATGMIEAGFGGRVRIGIHGRCIQQNPAHDR